MKKMEKKLAICQLNMIDKIFAGGGMDVHTALSEFDLLNDDCLKLAQQEGLEKVADWIKNFK